MPENGHVTANMALTNGSLVQRILLLEVNSPQFNKLRCLGSTRALELVLLFGKQGRFDMAQGKP
jgi:hypothetical protein